MLILAVLFFACHAQMNKVLLSNTKCLDGSPAGYYFANATASANNTKWAIFFEGGGDCATLSSCESRTKGPLGSSSYWGATYTDNGNVLSTNPSVNPGFATWNHVYIPYCTGDTHAGQRNTVDPSWGLFYFSGYLNAQSIFADISSKHNFQAAVQVLVSGSSAGGIGTSILTDTVSGVVPKAYVRGYPQGGYFFPNVTSYANWKAGVYAPAVDPSVIDLWNAWMSPSCMAAHPNKYDCGTADVYFNYLLTPLFVSENQFDTNQIYTQLGCPQNATDTNDYIAYFGAQMLVSTKNNVVNSSRGHALFLMSCLEHTSDTSVSSPTTISGYKQGPVVNDWYFAQNKDPHALVDNCGPLPCNPTCV